MVSRVLEWEQCAGFTVPESFLTKRPLSRPATRADVQLVFFFLFVVVLPFRFIGRSFYVRRLEETTDWCFVLFAFLS